MKCQVLFIARQTIQMKCQVLFPLKNKNKCFKVSSFVVVLTALRVSYADWFSLTASRKLNSSVYCLKVFITRPEN